MRVCSEAGLIGTLRCGDPGLATDCVSALRRPWISTVLCLGKPGLTTGCTSALRRRPALAGRTKCVDTLYDIRRRIGCKVVRFVRL